uniref:Uncharacterized protein n=1 Tax=Vespula pensylvanica TaxID=30213 RepID=A0A834UD81_VESPE|nr:hypothetical protein H0235_004671 [Vespula pensylvanica]
MASKPPSEIARCPSDFINVSSESHIPQSAFRGNLRAQRVYSEGGLRLGSQKTKNSSSIRRDTRSFRYIRPKQAFCVLLATVIAAVVAIAAAAAAAAAAIATTIAVATAKKETRLRSRIFATRQVDRFGDEAEVTARQCVEIYDCHCVLSASGSYSVECNRQTVDTLGSQERRDETPRTRVVDQGATPRAVLTLL